MYMLSDLFTKILGFGEGRKEEVYMTRLLAYCASSSTHPKHFSIEKFWPMEKKQRLNDIKDPVTRKERAMALKQRYIDAGLLSAEKRN